MMRIGSKQIKFELNIGEKVPVYLLGDELRVKQILSNLLSNAIKYTEQGAITLSVDAETDELDKSLTHLILSVRDTGQGMTKEQVAVLFDEYTQFNQELNRTTEGTGLGMNITKNLLNLMNGKISVESERGKGSVFTVRIPQGAVSSETLGVEMIENLRLFRTKSRAQMKRVQISQEPMPYGSVLIVDDVDTNLYVAKGLMTPYKLQIETVNSGFEAIERVKSGKVYDIIFMDHMMPKMDGAEATKIIREMGYGHTIIALTANAVVGQAEVFLSNGFDDYVSKPIDIRHLNIALNKHIRDKQPPEVLEAARLQAEEDKTPDAEDAGTQAGVNTVLIEIFIRDAQTSVGGLNEIVKKGFLPDDMGMYIILVHGLKSALANVGNTGLSDTASKLERMGRDGNMDVVTSETPAFIHAVLDFVDEMNAEIKKADDAVTDESEEDKTLLRDKLAVIQSACEDFDEEAIENALTSLRAMSWSQPTKNLLSDIYNHLIHSDYDIIAGITDEYLNNR
jgi:CheY-like chemotaxis protein/anti-sigma regulatory factor (Ser/Thr protein kinase)